MNLIPRHQSVDKQYIWWKINLSEMVVPNHLIQKPDSWPVRKFSKRSRNYRLEDSASPGTETFWVRTHSSRNLAISLREIPEIGLPATGLKAVPVRVGRMDIAKHRRPKKTRMGVNMRRWGSVGTIWFHHQLFPFWGSSPFRLTILFWLIMNLQC